MIEVAKLRYGDKFRAVDGHGGVVYLYLRRGADTHTCLAIASSMAPMITVLWLTDPRYWVKVP